MKSIPRVILFTLAPVFFCSLAGAAELFTNGDFESGVTGFTSDYSFDGVDNSLTGQFAVTSSPSNVHPSWALYGRSHHWYRLDADG